MQMMISSRSGLIRWTVLRETISREALPQLFFDDPLRRWTLLTKVETSCDRILIAGGANVEAEWEQGPAV